MERRAFIAKSALFTAAAAVSPSLAFAAEKAKASKGNSLVDAAADCKKKADLCLDHCIESLSTGSTAMAACAATVREVQIYCDALAKAAAQKSKHVKELAKIALAACQECEKECRKHKMQVCVDCAESCAACAKECMSA